LDKGVWEYGKIKDSDKVMIAVSGGAGSWTFLKILSERYTIY
jgi:tRNA(Ile)-lysidine synthase TilS/MesJ